ncbi:MAG: glycosyltransferase family 9 protein [Selenomonadaceae bacterium]|nr:glycosyltransferase family 9 protein [Selenomonadaceae bacterium]
MEKFFAELIPRLKANPSRVSELMFETEAAFKRAGYREKVPATVENILIVRLDVIGDMILTSGFIREVKANFPKARITLICSSLTFPLVELCPYVNEILTFDITKIGGAFPNALEKIVPFCQENLWRKRFSYAFSPQWGSWNLPMLLLCWLSGARERIGYGTNPYRSYGFEVSAEESAIDNFLLTKNITPPRSIVSDLRKNFYILEAAGFTVNSNHVELFYGAEDFYRARELLKNIPPTCKKVILGLGAGGDSRKYPVEKYLIALKELAKKNLVFVIVGGKSELKDAEFIEKNMPQGKVLNLVGKTTLRETEAIISQTDFYLGNVTGIMHMAAACKIPVLALYHEPQDKEDYLPGAFSELGRYPPHQTNSVILRPAHQLEECARLGRIYGWCHSEEPHCITQIEPQEIIDGFEILETL